MELHFPRHCLLIFVDGLGLREDGAQPFIHEACPFLNNLVLEHAESIDACLGVSGLPQSATGQTAMFTGRNAAALVGGHREGFPDALLREIIEEDNLFLRLVRSGRSATFANAYVRGPGHSLPMVFRSVTTVMTLSALGGTRGRDQLLAGEAVYHDLNRKTVLLRNPGVEPVPEITEAQAAADLLAVTRTVDFCLFEYFLTDHAGHREDPEETQRVLCSLDAFLSEVVSGLDSASELLLLVSDHGNIESPESRRHSFNRVPWIALGCAAAEARRGMASLVDVTPKILSVLGVPESPFREAAC